MIELKDFSFNYPNSPKNAISNVSLRIEEGEFVIIKGPSGCGKSTLCLALNGIIPHIINGDFSGEVVVKGGSTLNRKVKELATDVGIVFQNPDNQLFAITVEEDVAFGPENLGLDRSLIRERVEDALLATDIEQIRCRNIHVLSGGQKQRTAIAGLCAMKPDILVLDEPTSDLDPQGTRDVVDVLKRLNKNEGKTIVVIEHKIDEFLPVADRVITLCEGVVREDCHKSALGIKEIRNNFPWRIQTCNDNKRPILDIRNLNYKYPDGTKALKDINLSFNREECVAVIGNNGSGKSTLMKMIKGLIKPYSGDVVLYDPSTEKIVKNRSGHIGYLFQNPDHQIVTSRVDSEIAIGLRNMPDEVIEKKTNEALNFVNLITYRERDPCTLSRGERQRLAVASILAMEPEIIICDEPTTGQDYDNLVMLMEYLEECRIAGKTLILVTHDHDLAYSYADRVITMDLGRCISDEQLT